MRFTSDTVPNIGKVLSRDQSRPVLTMAYLDAARAVLEGTDSYKLVSIPVELEEHDVSGFVPVDALNAFHKACKKHRYGDPPSLACEEHDIALVLADGTRSYWKRENPGTFPNVPQLIPEEHARSSFRVRLNARYLFELAQALGGDEVTVQFVRSSDHEEGEDVGVFPNNLRPMIVTNGAPDHGMGILMPMRIPS